MNKRTFMIALVLVLVVCCISAYAADAGASGGNSNWTDFWNGVGGFFNNALPWNWGNWVGK